MVATWLIRKVRALLACEARVCVVGPRVCKSIRALYDEKRIELVERTYETADLKGAALVFAATNDAATNERVSQDARERGILVNVADSPDLCDFIVPAVDKTRPYRDCHIHLRNITHACAQTARRDSQTTVEGSYALHDEGRQAEKALEGKGRRSEEKTGDGEGTQQNGHL